MESDADYHGSVAQTVLKPILKGSFFDWTSDAWLAGGTLDLKYQRQIGAYEIRAHGGLSEDYVDTFATPDGEVDFSGEATTFAAGVDLVCPTDFKLLGHPLALVPHLGNVTFLGPNQDALGFDYFFEGGLSLEANLADAGWGLQQLRLGASAMWGDSVQGWSLIVGRPF